MSDLFTIVLKHVGGERKTLPVEDVNSIFVTVRWGQSGLYELDLRANTLKARSLAARRKGPALWAAEDIEAVRKMARDHLDALSGNPEAARAERAARHAETMPGVQRRRHDYGPDGKCRMHAGCFVLRPPRVG